MKFIWGFLGIAFSFWLGFFIGTVDVPVLRTTPSMIFATGTIQAYPTNIMLRIVDHKSFRDSDTVAMLKSTQVMKGVAAYTRYTVDPCEVVLPDNFKISVVAPKGVAVFDSVETADTLAHEILHCLYGAWHPPWNVIHSKSNLAMPKENVLPR